MPSVWATATARAIAAAPARALPLYSDRRDLEARSTAPSSENSIYLSYQSPSPQMGRQMERHSVKQGRSKTSERYSPKCGQDKRTSVGPRDLLLW